MSRLRINNGQNLVDRRLDGSVLYLRPNVFDKLRKNIRLEFGRAVTEHTPPQGEVLSSEADGVARWPQSLPTWK